MIRIGILVVGLVLLAATPVLSVDRTDDYTYVTAAVERGTLRETVTATGTVNAVGTVEVGSQLSGQIDELYVDFNTEVEKGQVLARLDQNEFEAELAKAQAALAMARAQVEIQTAAVERKHINIRDTEVRVAVLQARLANARAVYMAADADHRRKALLREGGNVSASHFDRALAEREAANASVHEAKALLLSHDEAIAGAKADLDQANAELAYAKANVRQQEAVLRVAEVNLERSTIRSPIDGIVIKRDVERGQTVAASLEAPTLFTIAEDLREMEVNARIDETDIGQIKVGQKVSFSVDAYPGRRFQGEITQIRKAHRVVQNVVTYTAVISTKNPALLLFPGMTALVEVVVMESEDLLKVPSAAVSFTPTGVTADADNSTKTVGQENMALPGIVWKLGDQGRLEPVRVRLGLRDASSVQLLEGLLSEGDEVVVNEIPVGSGKRFFGIRLGF